jgi:UDP-N-acetylmuramate dehydrogenase
MIHSFLQNLVDVYPTIKLNQRIAPYTTFNIGGASDYLAIPESNAQISELIKVCIRNAIPVKIIGGGSNLIVSDSGFRGLIIINKIESWNIIEDHFNTDSIYLTQTQSRLSTVGKNFYTTEGLDYQDPPDKRILVNVTSGTRIIPLIKNLFQHEITGLQWFSGIPASVGGAVYMNMHGGNYYFGDLVYKAKIFNGKDIRTVDNHYFNFKYDYSILHETRETVLEADLLLYKGDVKKARDLSIDWARRKSLQPQRSAGCIFQNLTPEDQERLKLPTPSIGYLIDKVLGLQGIQKGDALISRNHAAFIENKGSATATDVFYLYNLIQEKAKTQLNLTLKPEVEFVGIF